MAPSSRYKREYSPSTCPCGVEFIPKRKGQIYHNSRCKTELWHRKRARELRAEIICRHMESMNAELVSRGLCKFNCGCEECSGATQCLKAS